MPSTSPFPAFRRGVIGDKLLPGQVVLTASGRPTTPFPRVDNSSERKAVATCRRMDAWLRENAIAEAAARRDEFNGASFHREDPHKMPQDAKDCMEMYLFDSELLTATKCLPSFHP